jgi:polyisoprenoid-binding protein YceI
VGGFGMNVFSQRPNFSQRSWISLGGVLLFAAVVAGCGSDSVADDGDSAGTDSVATVVAGGSTVAGDVAEATEAAAADSGIDGSWQVGAGSEAGYRVPEVLNGQTTEGVGRTSGVTGSMTVVGTSVTASEFVFDMTKLTSDSGKRDSQVQGRIMETATFPTATFVLGGPVDLGKIPADKEEVSIPAKGSLTVRGTTLPVELTLNARRNGATIEVLGSYDLKFADFGIPDPSVKPFVEVGQSGFIEWLLVFEKKA